MMKKTILALNNISKLAEEKLKAKLYELRANFRAEQAAKKKRKK